MRKVIFAILISTLFFSCKKDKNTATPNFNYNYANLKVGKYVIYNVDSITFNDFTGTVDTSKFQIKEVLASNYTDLEGDNAFKIIRYKKDVDSLTWVLTDVWDCKITTRTYEKVVENVRYIKMIFPIRLNQTWNGNSKNNLGNLTYEFTSVHQPEVIGGNALDSVSTVLQNDNINLVQEEYAEEKFAANIGLVYKKNISKIRSDLSSPWSGYDVTMTLLTYGNN